MRGGRKRLKETERQKKTEINILKHVPLKHRPQTHLAAVEGHGEVGVLGLSRSCKHRRDSLTNQLHLGHVSAAPSQVHLRHGNALTRGDTPVLMGHEW